jgi:predicted RNase H-like nuclease
MGEDNDSTTAQRLKLLELYVVPGRQGPAAARSAPTVKATAAARVDIMDHMAAAVDEVITHTRAAAPHAGDIPRERANIYDWYREHTAVADADVQRGREILIYRQGLEHAIAMGDTKVVRTHPCRACGCVGLFWDRVTRKAVCVNQRCTSPKGLTNTWSLSDLAEDHIRRQETRKLRAT